MSKDDESEPVLRITAKLAPDEMKHLNIICDGAGNCPIREINYQA